MLPIMARQTSDFMERVPRRIITDTQYSLFRLNFRISDITVGRAFSSASYFNLFLFHLLRLDQKLEFFLYSGWHFEY